MLMDIFTKDSERATNWRYTLQAIVCFFMWMKMFYFLRMWQKASYFIHTLIEVISKSKVFLFIYFLLLFCFAITFLIGSPDSNQNIFYYMKQTYEIGLGGDAEEFDNSPVQPLLKAFYILGTLVVAIVMLNLLISVIGTHYEEIVKFQVEANCAERVKIVADVAEMLNADKRKRLSKGNQFLIKAEVAKTKAQKQ